MGDKTFNLTWNNHLANLSGLFEGLYKSESLTDTTLACQGGMLRAHRLVLAACSPFFERVFKEHNGEQPILILKSVAVEEMECLLEFCYRGSIDVAECRLGSLIQTATELEIRGLSGDYGTKNNPEYKKDSQAYSQKPPSSSDSLEMTIKMEEIEVEDDPMVMEGDESGFGEPHLSEEENKIVSTPSAYNRETRFKGQKRVAVGRSVRSSQDESVKSRLANLKQQQHELSLNGASSDPTVPDIQMKEDDPDQIDDMDSTEEEKPKKSMSELTGRKGDNSGISKDGKNQYKPFSCDLCTLAFTRASHLARHRRVHTGERPFACTLCPRLFARQDKLKQHLDSHLQPKKFANRNSVAAAAAAAVAAAAASSARGTRPRGRPRKARDTTNKIAVGVADEDDKKTKKKRHASFSNVTSLPDKKSRNGNINSQYSDSGANHSEKTQDRQKEVACHGEKNNGIEDSHSSQGVTENSSSDGDKKFEKDSVSRAYFLSDDSDASDIEGCDTSEEISVTLNMIKHVEQCIHYLKIQYAKQDKERSKKTEQVPDEKATISEGMPKWKIPSPSKRELVPDSGVWIKSFKIDYFFKEASGITDMVRLLLRELIGKEVLRVSCARGNSERRAIDPAVLIAIKAFVQHHYNGGKKYDKFIKIVNKYCYYLRNVVDTDSVKKTFIDKPVATQNVDFDFVECD